MARTGRQSDKTTSSGAAGLPRPRRPVADRVMQLEGRWLMGRLAPRGSPRLTTVLCAWDANWMRAVDPAVSGLRAERTSLMSLGDDACRFRVVRTDDRLATYRDELQERPTGEDVPRREGTEQP